ncbi:hypothetical protein ACFRDV_18985 [Streptomyces fagopyri]|uniref:hypothetical protein n=1 Tax=Streptomyces fagopyri TaxID=2662397 RepID=UPI0036992972
MAGKDEVHWNAETQSWETGGAPQGRYTPPPPPRPEFEPVHPPGPAPAPGQAPEPGPEDGSGPGSGPGSSSAGGPGIESAGSPGADSGTGSAGGPGTPGGVGPGAGPGVGRGQPSQYPAPVLHPGPDQGGHHPAYWVPGPLPAPGAASRPSVRRVVAVLTAALLVGGAAGFGGWYVWSRDGGGAHKDDARTKVSSAPTGPDAEDPASVPAPTPAPTLDATSASPSASALPAGYHRASNGEFDMAVPDGWQPETQSGKNGVTIYFFRESGGGPRYLQVFRVSEDNPTPRGTLTAAEKDLRKQLPGYHRNSLTTVPDARGEAAELDYSHPSVKWGVEVRTLDRVVPVGGGELYVVLTSGPSGTWPAQRQIQEAAVTSFCLAGAC